MYLCDGTRHVRKFCMFKLHFFELKLISNKPNQFNGSISKSAVNLEKIGRGKIFAVQAR